MTDKPKQIFFFFDPLCLGYVFFDPPVGKGNHMTFMAWIVFLGTIITLGGNSSNSSLSNKNEKANEHARARNVALWRVSGDSEVPHKNWVRILLPPNATM